MDHNHHLTTKATIPIDISLMPHGALVVTDLSTVTEVLGDVRVWS